jgi:DNA-binding transcriptional LysR family regulator
MKIDPRHLVQLAAIVEAGGMTEGAALVGSTQPALSRTVALLEARLGEPLFHRGRRPLEPTALGRALAEQGAAIRIAAERASKAVDAFRHGESGAIRIGGTPFFMDALISGMVASFQKRHPGVRVDQSYGYTSALAAQVRGGRLDLAICPIEVLEEDSDLAFEEILPGRNVVACRADHPLMERRPLRPAALLDYPWIEPPPGSPLNADLRTTLLALRADRIRVSYAGGSLASIVNHMIGSDSLAVLPHSVVFAMRRAGEITALPLQLEHPPRALGVLRARGPGRLPAAERFAAHVADQFAALRDLIRRHEQVVIWGRG